MTGHPCQASSKDGKSGCTQTHPKLMKAFLILEDGQIFEGRSFGAVKEAVCEVVFNTSMTGYLEVLTDPSYQGQGVVMTYPLIGNYGMADITDKGEILCITAKLT